MMKFDMPKEQSSIIKVIGVGGGGSNAVNHMYKEGITGVDFIICNTDRQALDKSPVPIKIQLGTSLTEGLGAGSIAEVGREAAIENINEIREILENNTKMVFITAGMGGGTGTGATPIIAAIAKELGILTIAIVTLPFSFEGKRRKLQAQDGIVELKKSVDALLIINNDKLRDMGGNLKMGEAFALADNILTNSSKSIAEIITVTGHINLDFEDVRTVMSNSGVAIMGSSIAEGEGRAIKAVANALASPLLNDNNIKGASKVLICINSGDDEITMDEIHDITEYAQEEAGLEADIFFGTGYNEHLGNKIAVTIVATGFNTVSLDAIEGKQPERKVMNLVDSPSAKVEHITHPIIEAKKETIQQEEKEDLEINSFEMDINEVESEFEQTSMFSSENNHSEIEEESNNHLEFEVIKLEESIFEEHNGITMHDENEIQEDLSRARIARLKELSLKIKTPQGVKELENRPAYERRNISLENTPHSSDSQVSRYTLSENEGKTEIRPTNSFLHDNVD